MPSAAQILTWGRIDPYYIWSEVSHFADDPAMGQPWLPLLVEAVSAQAATDLRAKLQGEFPDSFFVPLANAGGACISLYVKQDAQTEKLLKYLSGQNVHWELGLPFTGPAAMPLAASARPAGTGQVVGFIDYGCAFAHRQFRAWVAGAPTLGSRVLSLWDQPGNAANSVPAAAAGIAPPAWTTPPDFGYGVEWNRTAAAGQTGLGIDAYMQQFAGGGSLDEEQCYAKSGYQGVDRPEAHGTHVMDLAVGHPNSLPGAVVGQALPAHDIVFVQLPRLAINGHDATWLLRAHVLDAVRYIFSCAAPTQPVTINLSYGGYAGPHDGKTTLERALDEAIKARRQTGPTELLIAAGNAAAADLHVEAVVPPGGPPVSLTWCNGHDSPTDQFTEIWFDDTGVGCEVRFTAPGQAASPWVAAGNYEQLGPDGKVQAMLVAPTDVGQSRGGRRMVLFAVGPTRAMAGRATTPYGDWTLEVRNVGTANARVRAWIERNDPVSTSGDDPRQARFKGPGVTPYETLNSLSHGQLPIVVGGYVGGSGRVCDYTARGQHQTAPGGCSLPSLNASGKKGPDWLAVSEESEVDEGMAGAAVIGADQVRRSGTSVACAVATRYVVQQRAAGVGGIVPPPPTPQVAEAEWQLPRVP